MLSYIFELNRINYSRISRVVLVGSWAQTGEVCGHRALQSARDTDPELLSYKECQALALKVKSH